MKIRIKDFAVTMQLGNNGVVFDVHDNQDNFKGDLRIGRATVEWCKGKKREGQKVHWDELIEWFEKR
ncbi:MAG TPA: hypothetical protein VJ860_12645 [Polyangia bacterium]|jgi:hypothetical protein|nr:hypothetical protein [Polyangia bacterium]